MPVLIRVRPATRLLGRSSSTDLVKCATGAFESQVYRASGLNLLIAAIILWNTRYLEQTFVELDRQGADVSPTIVAHVAPLGWEHVGLTGDYVWSDGQQPSNGSLRPLRRRESMLAA